MQFGTFHQFLTTLICSICVGKEMLRHRKPAIVCLRLYRTQTQAYFNSNSCTSVFLITAWHVWPLLLYLEHCARLFAVLGNDTKWIHLEAFPIENLEWIRQSCCGHFRLSHQFCVRLFSASFIKRVWRMCSTWYVVIGNISLMRDVYQSYIPNTLIFLQSVKMS